MPLLAKRSWIDRGEPTHDGEHRGLWLRRRPLWIELGVAHPFLVMPLRPSDAQRAPRRGLSVVPSDRANLDLHRRADASLAQRLVEEYDRDQGAEEHGFRLTRLLPPSSKAVD